MCVLYKSSHGPENMIYSITTTEAYNGIIPIIYLQTKLQGLLPAGYHLINMDDKYIKIVKYLPQREYWKCHQSQKITE